jgi:hypothetical protein
MTTRVCLTRYGYNKNIYTQIRLLTPSNPATIRVQSKLISDIMKGLTWSVGTGKKVMLKVRFLSEGSKDSVFQEKVNKVIKVVESKIVHAHFLNVGFDFLKNDDDAAHIRIAFVPNQGSWSALGTEALKIEQDVATMNLSWLSDGNILHQFAHALGFLHESEYTSIKIPWNKDAVYDAFNGPPHYWNKLEVDRNFLSVFNVNQFLNFEKYDASSLMRNILPCSFFTQTPPFRCLDARSPVLDTDYSNQDKQAFEKYYPFTNSTETYIPVISTDGANLETTRETSNIEDNLTILETPFRLRSVNPQWITLLANFLAVLLLALIIVLIVLQYKIGCWHFSLEKKLNPPSRKLPWASQQ